MAAAVMAAALSMPLVATAKGADVPSAAGLPVLTWQPPVSVDDGQLNAIACPSTSECVAVDSSGQEVTFDPAAPAHATVATVDSGRALSALSCPSASQCIAVDGSGNSVTFHPTPPVDPQTTDIDAATTLRGVACASTTSGCTAVDNSGNALSLTPLLSANLSSSALVGIACTGSLCTAISGSRELTFYGS
ncbi:MAG: hypothetical protein ACRDLV_09325, partial [Solirubrobacteraceae bacterium]